MKEAIDMSHQGNTTALAKQIFEAAAEQMALIRRVLAYTETLVDQALRADWNAVLDGMQERRRLLQIVVDNEGPRLHSEVAALVASVEESERALMRVVAHAIAGSRRNNACFAMYH